jgi:hypothetical protein
MIHPVDRLHEIRQQIKDLQAEQRAIRSQIIRGEAGLVGAEYVAKQRRQLLIQPKQAASPYFDFE